MGRDGETGRGWEEKKRMGEDKREDKSGVAEDGKMRR
jgi:hypothetical protein